MRLVLDAEVVKARKSWHFLAALLGPLCQVGPLALICWYSADRIQPFRPGFRFWIDLNFAVWNLLFMPMTGALVCDLNWDLERTADPAGSAATQPVSARERYLAKLLVNLMLLTGATLLLALLVPWVGVLLRQNSALLMGPWPVAMAGKQLAWSLLALPAVVAFQTWLSRIQGDHWPALGIALLGIGLTYHLGEGSIFGALLPWSFAARATIALERWRNLPWIGAPLSLSVALAFIFLGAPKKTQGRGRRP